MPTFQLYTTAASLSSSAAPPSSTAVKQSLASTYLSDLTSFHSPSFSILHLNINSLTRHLVDANLILDTLKFDLICFNESKLDDTIPPSFFTHNQYLAIRCDRNRHGGGTIVFIKRKHAVTNIQTKSKTCNIEFVSFRIKSRSNTVQFICSYKPPIDNDILYIDQLDNYINSFDLSEPIVIIGDLNMNLDDNNNTDFAEFLTNNHLTNFVTEPTRVATISHSNSLTTTSSSTLIDVILHNANLITKTATIDCPFSDHKFVLANLQLDSITRTGNSSTCISTRCLSNAKLLSIQNATQLLNHTELSSLADVNSRWSSLKASLVNILNTHAPLKTVHLPQKDNMPWVDLQLRQHKAARDDAYKKHKISKLLSDHQLFLTKNSSYLQMKNQKMIEYFKNKRINDFSSNKKYWELYSAHINIRSCRANTLTPSQICNGPISATQPEQISNMFNEFFCSLSATTSSSFEQSSNFINQHFDTLINSTTLTPSQFSFQLVTEQVVKKTIESLDANSGPGLPGLPSKIFKPCSGQFLSIITQLINDCLSSGCIPLDWKSALVTALHKGKGSDSEDINNYRSIAVLPPLAKVFEKIVTSQISIYFNMNNLLFVGQHGFRANHSCETALHEIITDMLNILGKRFIGLFLFIDFRKAFDLINPQLLLIKLRRYGFDQSALKLMLNYFTDRSQTVKFNGHLSSPLPINLGVPQGSVLGPLLFLIYINDLPFFASNLQHKLFADDTTSSLSRPSFTELMRDFNLYVNDIIIWCNFNQLDINWSKTKAMFISKKMDTTSDRRTRLHLPSVIYIGNLQVEVVQSFKLLGVTIDNKLNFLLHASNVRRSVNSRLYSIKKLFYLPFQVKLQFFKTFILPLFDYCSTLLFYFSRRAIQKISDCYYLSLYKLFNFSKFIAYSPDFNLFHDILKSFNLSCFQHRVILRLSTFIHNILYSNTSPPLLSKYLIRNNSLSTAYPLRNLNEFRVPAASVLNNHADFRFPIFFAQFCNLLLLPYLPLDKNKFKTTVIQNLNSFFLSLVSKFGKFDLTYCINF